MTTVLSPEQFRRYAESLIEEAEEEEMCILIGDHVGDYDISAPESGKYSEFKRIGKVGYHKAAFERDGTMDLLESSGALFGTIFVDREALSDEALEQIEAGDEEVVEA